jgi:glucose-6-phosphate isomerase
MTQLTQLDSWQALERHAQDTQPLAIKALRNAEHPLQADYQIQGCQLTLDFSNQRINDDTIKKLLALAEERDVSSQIQALIRGENVNSTEQKPALHTALRTIDADPVWVNGKNIIPDVLKARELMRQISDRIRSQNWLGFSGKPITDIINIGIGGSDLGPRFCIQALAPMVNQTLRYHFISDADPDRFHHLVSTLQPETTLFIIASKSFTTPETLYNAKKAMKWLGSAQYFDQHIIAVTANVEKAKDYGFCNVLPIWSWVGGRFSLCSAVNLITAIAIGFDAFMALLNGANAMDKHFQTAPFANNLPVMLALLGIWNNNFLHIHTLLLLTYAQQLEQFVPYIQQLEMESNGKSVNCHGAFVNFATAPIIWGGLGNQAQHSYYQLLSQGTHQITADFITVKSYEGEMIDELCRGKIQVLTQGASAEHHANEYIPGNVPLNTICLDNLSPQSIGALIALYEHKAYVQSVIWGINPFDQPGVDRAKRVKRISYDLA